MKRRQFFRRLAAAATAFVVAPGVFRAIPAARNVRAVVAAPSRARIDELFISLIPSEYGLGESTRKTWWRFLVLDEREILVANEVSSDFPPFFPYADFKARLDAARKSEKNFLATDRRLA